MVLVLILDAVGHHQISVLRWHDRLQGAWAFVIRHWDCHGSGATELYWVLVHTLFKRIIREELYYLAVSTSKSTSTLSSTPVHPYHRHLAPVVSLALRGKEKKDASEHLQKRAQTRASEHLSATSATTLVGVPHTTSQARQGCIEDDDSGLASTSLFQPPTSVVAQHHARISLVGDFIFGWEITGRWGMPLIYFSW